VRPMNIDPTFAPYLAEVVSGRPIPLHLADVAERRAAMRALRRAIAPAPPPDVRIERRSAPGPAGDVPLRLYRPAGPSGALPGVLYVHGGGWMYGSAEQSEPTAIRFCRGGECVVVSPDYRLTPEHPFPAGLDDCYAVLEWLAAEADGLGVDRGRLAVMGDSSGANLAAGCCFEARGRGGPRLRGQVLNYPALGLDFETASYVENADAPVLCRDEMIYFWKHYVGAELACRDPRAVPLAADDFRGLPPAYVTTAEYDPLREDGKRYAAALAAAGVSVEIHNAARLTHGFLRGWPVSQDAAAFGEAVCAALRRMLLPR